MSSSELTEMFASLTAEYAPRVLLAIVILIVGLIVVRLFVRVIRRVIARREVDPGVGGFLTSVLKALLNIVVLISVASTLGIQMTSFVAIIGAAGLAVALAFQGTLSNFAGGLLILIFKPFSVGDFIEANGIMGTVVEVQILYTLMNTFDNKRVTVPNGGLANTAVTNFSVNPTRRLDLTFGISYHDSIDRAKALIGEVISETESVLAEPEPVIGVIEHAANCISITTRVWVNRADFFPTLFALNEGVKKKFDEHGITIPFPQRDVHLYRHEIADGSSGR